MAAGQIWANTEQLNYLLDLISEVPSLRVLNSRGSPLLTPREEQVVALVAEGLGNRQMAGFPDVKLRAAEALKTVLLAEWNLRRKQALGMTN